MIPRPAMAALSTIPEDELNPNVKFPKGLIFILVYTVGERFSFYGLQVVLTLYLIQQIKLSLSTSKIIYHTFGILTSFLPIFGGIISDVYLGKFWTIFSFSFVYVSGFVLLTGSSVEPFHFNPRIVFVCISLSLMAVGSCGFKSNLVAIGGDQYYAGSQRYRDHYFSLNFWLVNIIALIAFVAAPLIRAEFSCFGNRFCYPLLFAAATIFMIIAIVVFGVGNRYYVVVPPKRSLLKEILACCWHAYRKRASSEESRAHWLDFADDTYSLQFIQDVKTVCKVLLLFITLPVFWALFDQQGSSWTYQASLMDGRIGKFIEIHPETMLSLNPLLIIILVPFFDFVIYPFMTRHNMLTRPLQRMITGGFITAAAFVICGVLQIFIEKVTVPLPSTGHVDLMVISGIPKCPIDIHVRDDAVQLDEYDGYLFADVKLVGDMAISVVPSDECSFLSDKQELWINTTEQKGYTLLLWFTPVNLTLESFLVEQIRERDALGKTFIRFIFMDELPFAGAKLTLQQGGIAHSYEFVNNFTQVISVWPTIPCKICWSLNNSCVKTLQTFQTYKGGVFEILLLYNNKTKVGQIELIEIVPEDQVHILYQVPQYFLLTVGETMLTLTGIKFLYSQAPPTMKSVMQSFFFLSIATGNLIVIIVEQVKLLVNITSEYIIFFVFAVIMFSDMFALVALSNNYIYKQHDHILI